MDQREGVHLALTQTTNPDAFPYRLGYDPCTGDPDDFRQPWATSRMEMASMVMDRAYRGGHIYQTVYGYPHGHSKQGNIPIVDCAYIDIDIRNDEPYKTDPTPENWKAAINRMLMPVRELAQTLIDMNMAPYFRACLSGHKGVHLYLDFEALPEGWSKQAVTRSMRKYTDDLINKIEGGMMLDIRDYVDVDGSDLARLTRVPNTVHPSTTDLLGVKVYCVPVTIEELANVQDAGEYFELCKQPRMPDDWLSKDSTHAREWILALLLRHSRESIHDSSSSVGVRDESRIEEYQKEYGLVHMNEDDAVNKRDFPEAYEKDHYFVDDVEQVWTKCLRGNRPCIKAFYQRDDAYQKGFLSHRAELYMVSHMISLGIPYDIMLDFLKGPQPDGKQEWSLGESRKIVDEAISYGYEGWACESMLDYGMDFCCEEACGLYNDTMEAKYT